jgi:hypothetical protein
MQCCKRTGCFAHLRVCIQPDWRGAPSSSGDAACAILSRLHEWLQRREQPNSLLRHEAVCLARVLPAALAGVNGLGRVSALAEALPQLAFPLCHGLMQAVSDPRRSWLPGGACGRVQHVFAALGPGYLRTALADIRTGVPGSPQRACTAAKLTNTYLQMAAPSEQTEEQLESQQQPALVAEQQVHPPHLDVLLLATVLLLSSSVRASMLLPYKLLFTKTSSPAQVCLMQRSAHGVVLAC